MAGPWEKYGGVPVAPQAAPQALPAEILGPPKTPEIPSGYQPDPTTPGALRPIPGGPADKSANGDSLSPDALNAETTNWILTGKMSPMGMGNGPLRVQIQNNRPLLMKKYGIGDNQLPAIQKQFDADAKAYAQRTQQGSYMNQAFDAAMEHVNQISGYLRELPAQTDLTPLNAITLGAQRAASGTTVTNLDATIPLLQSEIAKIMTANPTSGAGQLTDDARHEFDILNSSRSPSAKLQAMQALVEMARRKITGNAAESDRLSQRLNGGLEAYAHLGSANGPGGGPPDAVDRTNTGDVTPVAPGGTSRTEPFPEASAFIDSMVASDTPYPVALKQYRDRFPDAPVFNPEQYGAALAYHSKHPNDNSGYGAATRTIPLSQAEQNNNALAQSAPVAFLGAAANGATAGLPVAAAGDQGQYYQAIQSQQHPDATFYGDLAGTTAGMIGGEAALGRAGMKAGLKRELIANSGYGAVRGGADNPDNPLGGAATGALAAGAGTVAGNALLRGGAAALRGVTNPDVNALAQAGVGPMTVGQIVGNSGRTGQLVKAVEDRLAGFAGPGTMINARRAEGYKTFNSKAFDKALEPINGSVNGAVGEEAVAKASDAVSQAFSGALKGKSALPDEQFVASARGPLERLSRNKRVGPEIVDAIEGATEGLFDPATGALSGENMQAFLQGLRQIREGYRQDPLYQTLIKPSLQGIEGAVEGMFKRQAPEVMPQYNAAKAAYRRLSILADAVDRGKQTEGVFTPSQLGIADRVNAKKYDGKISAASGESPFFDLQRAGQNVLPGKVPDSGTAGRLAMLGVHASPVAVGAGLGYATGDTKGGAEAGLGLAGLLALIYTRGGQARLGKLLLDRSPRAQAAAAKLLRLAPVAGAGGAAIAQPNQ